MKTVKCNYKQCKYGGRVVKSNSVKVGNLYYHKECRQEMEGKKQIRDLYYEKYGLEEGFAQVNLAINKYVEEFGVDYIIFVLKQNLNLNSIYGLSYFLKDDRFEQSFEREKAKLIKFNINEIEVEKPKEIKYKKPKKQQLWGDMILKGDDTNKKIDISRG